MIRFECDYAEGAHERIIGALVKTNFEQTPGYGEDIYCEEARALIRKECKNEDLYVQFLVGGTQANLTVIAAALRPHEGVLCASTGHINVHETGAVEATGHKVLPLPSEDGKITAEQIEEAYLLHINDSSFEHMVKPGLVYISNPTECGTIYKKAELEAIYKVCQKYDLPLFLDGARLGYGLLSPENDMTMADIAANTDVFYIGGTKVGLLMGEAVVIKNEMLKRDFRYFIKQKGAMLAKGRLLGVQFAEAFRDGLYYEMSENAIALAEGIRNAFLKKGIAMRYDSPTNQLFPILTQEQCAVLGKDFAYSNIEALADGRKVVRFCTSWATKKEDAETLIRAIETL